MDTMDTNTKDTNTMDTKDTNTCIYDEICSKDKPCGDCAADLFDREQYEEAVEHFNLDRKMC